MFRLILTASVHTRYLLRRYMPTNIALDAIRSRRGLRWGVPAMLLALPYLYAASTLTVIIRDGAPGWLHLVVLLMVWNAMKFTVVAPVSLLLLVRARATESRHRRIERPAVAAETHAQSCDGKTGASSDRVADLAERNAQRGTIRI